MAASGLSQNYHFYDDGLVPNNATNSISADASCDVGAFCVDVGGGDDGDGDGDGDEPLPPQSSQQGEPQQQARSHDDERRNLKIQRAKT